MRAALIEKAGEPLQIVDDVEVDPPGPGEVLVRVTHCGVCHSDLHAADGSLPYPLPAIAGHEAAGVVERVGPGVKTHAEGDHVVLTCRPACGDCYWCVRGETFLCGRSTEWMTGVLADGGTRLSHRGRTVHRAIGIAGFAEYVCIDARGAITIGPELPLEVAAVLGCAVQTGIGAVLNTARVGPGDTVLILGLGAVGLCIAQGARIAGAALVLGVDPVASRREQATRFGVDELIDPAESDVVAAVLERTSGVGIDFAFDGVALDETIQSCVDATRPGGATVLVGVAPADGQVRVETRPLVADNKRILGSFLGSAHSARDFRTYVELWKAGRLDLEGLVTAVRPLDEINEAFADAHAAKGLRTVLSIGGAP